MHKMENKEMEFLPLALAYVRVSTGRQAKTGYSLESQPAILIKAARKAGYRVEIVTETGSGRNSSRPALNRALERLACGDAQALYALDIDRLARSTQHLADYFLDARARRDHARAAPQRGPRTAMSTVTAGAKISEDGVVFRSHLDGSKLFLGPREVMTIQQNLGSDIAMVLDECPPYPCDRASCEVAVTRSIRWAKEMLQLAKDRGFLASGRASTAYM